MGAKIKWGNAFFKALFGALLGYIPTSQSFDVVARSKKLNMSSKINHLDLRSSSWKVEESI